MSRAFVNSVVRLTNDVPTLWLSRGDVGVVKSVWLSPLDYYEVEFRKPHRCCVRALLNHEMIDVTELKPSDAYLHN